MAFDPATPNRLTASQTEIDGLLETRAATHGDFTEHAAITQAIKQSLAGGTGYHRMNACQTEALEMIAHKLGRIAAGNPFHIDHWADIAGYAQLVVQRLPVEKGA